MSNRKDFLAECNEHGVPVPDFQAAFCSRCMQPECTRSQHGKSKFDRRTLTWEDRLFLGVPKLSESDPRYLPILNADFRTISEGPTKVSIHNPSWNDPRDIPKNSAEIAKVPLGTVSIESQPPLEENPEKSLAPTLPSVVKDLPKHLLLLNAPAQPSMLPGALQQPQPDPWAGPVPKGEPLPSAPIVKKGAKIKFGGSSGVE